jgi:hypothetical protein
MSLNTNVISTAITRWKMKPKYQSNVRNATDGEQLIKKSLKNMKLNRSNVKILGQSV